MAKTMYDVNPTSYYRSGKRRPGATCDRVKSYIRTDDISKKDRDNRKIVIDTIKKYVENGVEFEKAVVMVTSNQKVRKAFDYLVKAGVDLKELFTNLYNAENNKKNKTNELMRE